MPECLMCDKPTKPNYELCLDCFRAEKSLQFSEQMIKGRIAETLIEQLFLNGGYEVYKYGMENTIPGLTTVLGKINSQDAFHMRRMPDFVVLSKDKQKVHFVEVKFRANGKFTFRDLGDNYPEGYDNAFVVVVSKRHIKCLTVKDLRSRKDINPDCRNWLGSRPEFHLDKDMIRDYCAIAARFFETV